MSLTRIQKKISYPDKLKNLASLVSNKFIPTAANEIGSLPYWRERILFGILFFGIVIGFFVIVLCTPAAIEYGVWRLLIFDGSVWCVAVFILLSPKIPYGIRAGVCVLIIYAIAVAITFSMGMRPISGPPLWLFCFSILTGVLLGPKAAIFAVLTNAITICVICSHMITIKWGLSGPYFNSLLQLNSPLFLITESINFLFLNALAAISISLLVKGLDRVHEKEKNIASILKTEQVRLIHAKNSLEKEFRERKQAELSLQESEKKYKYLFNNAPAGMFEIDFNIGKFIQINGAMVKYSGYSKDEFLSMTPMDLLTDNSKHQVLEEFRKHLNGEKNLAKAEYTVIRKDGKILSVFLNYDFVYEKGKMTLVRGVVNDLTELKHTEEEKRKHQEIAGEQKKLALVGQVAGKMAHDFNNILGIIMGNTELSLLDCKDANIQKTLELVFEQAVRGKNLTKNLVAFAKSHEPKQEFFRIGKKIDWVLNLLKKDLEGIELIKNNRLGLPDLLADSGMIEHALVNLLQNSIHAVSLVKNPKIMVGSFCRNNRICIEIEDNGCGIPEQHLDTIYDPSFTLKGSQDRTDSYEKNIKGTGYGMSNVKKYIDQHHGSISVESTFGSGTKFTIKLPVIKKELTGEEKKEIAREIHFYRKKILLVEDEADILDVQYRLLTQEPCNHKVDTAHNGQAALDLFNKNEYDFISLDYILLGKMTGMDVYHHIRKTDKTIPIIFVSGNLEFLESIKTLKQKDTHIDHLSKPCQNKEYLRSINRLMETL